MVVVNDNVESNQTSLKIRNPFVKARSARAVLKMNKLGCLHILLDSF